MNLINCILLCLLNIISFQCLYNDNPLCFDIGNYDFFSQKLKHKNLRRIKAFIWRSNTHGRKPGVDTAFLISEYTFVYLYLSMLQYTEYSETLLGINQFRLNVGVISCCFRTLLYYVLWLTKL